MDAFAYPIAPVPRTAVLVPWFSNGFSSGFANGFSSGGFVTGVLRPRPVRVFRKGWGSDVVEFAPAAIAGTWEQWQALLRVPIPSLTHAVIVLWRPGQERLTETDRDRLWDAFRVPVFEQVIGKSGELLASECEAHDGLHLKSSRLPTDNEYVDASPCPCGQKTSRVGCSQGTAMLRRIAAYAR